MALADNLTAYYSLDEASGNAIDAHGTHDGTDVNTVGAGTGIVSGARDFELDNSEYFTVTDHADFDITGGFTLNLWFKMETKAANCGMFSAWNGGSNRSFRAIYSVGDDSILAQFGDGSGSTLGSIYALTTPSTATWYMFTIWSDGGGTCNTKINDGTTQTGSFTPGNPTGDIRIGSDELLGPFDGLIDEIGFWQRALTGAEITELYNAGAGRDYSYITGGGGGGSSVSASIVRSKAVVRSNFY